MKKEGFLGLIESGREWLRESVVLRFLFVAFLILMLQIPVSMISATVRERQMTRDSAIAEVTRTWGTYQTVVGPILRVPWVERWKDEKGVTRETMHAAYFLPETLSFEGDVATEVRRRGIFDVPLYISKLTIRGKFRKPDLSAWQVNPKDILWKSATLSLGITDPKAVRELVTLDWAGKSYAFGPGVGDAEVFPAGIHLVLPNLDAAGAEFSIPIVFGGSSSLYFAPLGVETEVKLKSSWPDPSFAGAYLPTSRTVNAQGFEAYWKVLHLGRNFPQQWKDGQYKDDQVSTSAFGVSLLSPVDSYHMTHRAEKYQLLFLLLTFMAFTLFEIFHRLRIHPLQYLLVGFALCLFYLLLLSLSEHIGFERAYAVAAFAIVAITAGYCRAILRTGRQAGVIAALLAGLYVFLFVLLNIQDYALLVGSLGLAAALSGFMYLTRKVDWYNVGKSTAQDQP
jgi:inner membrane protein